MGLYWLALLDRKEFAAHREIAETLGIDVFFAHPYHPWECGANENMNGIIRQYIPKRSSFENLSDKDILLIQNKLNNRPRKRLKFLTPIEYFLRNFAPSIENFNQKVAFITCIQHINFHKIKFLHDEKIYHFDYHAVACA